MPLKLAISFHNFKIENEVEEFVWENLKLSKDLSVMVKEFGDDYFILSIGLLDVEQFKISPFWYSIFSDEQGSRSDQEVEVVLSYFFDLLMGFLQCSWFVKDNSSNIGALFAYDEESGKVRKKMSYKHFSNHEGAYSDTTFSSSELDEIKKFFYKQVELKNFEALKGAEQVQYVPGTPRASTYNFRDYNKNNRIVRAMDFLSLARGTSFLPNKISMFMPVFECLFSTDVAEITHQVGERVAFYVGGTKDEKMNNYRIIKDAYNLRSRYLHGDELSSQHREQEKLIELSKKVDDLARTILSKVMMEDSEKFMQKKEPLRQWLSQLIFSN